MKFNLTEKILLSFGFVLIFFGTIIVHLFVYFYMNDAFQNTNYTKIFITPFLAITILVMDMVFAWSLLAFYFSQKSKNFKNSKNATIFCTHLGKECIPDISQANIAQSFNPYANSYLKIIGNKTEITVISKILMIRQSIKHRKAFGMNLHDAFTACFTNKEFHIKPATAHEIIAHIKKKT